MRPPRWAACVPTRQDPFRADVPGYDAILTYGGGPMARDGYLGFGARAYYSMYNGLDPETHHPVAPDPSLACDVAFLGNRLPDREARVEELFFRAASLAPEHSFISAAKAGATKPCRQRALDRSRSDGRSQSRQLLGQHGDEHQSRVHGGVRLLSSHACLRSCRCRLMPALR